MTDFERIEPIILQPSFPPEDLSEKNVPLISMEMLMAETDLVMADAMEAQLDPLYTAIEGEVATLVPGIEENPLGLRTFAEGFSAFQFMSLSVNPNNGVSTVLPLPTERTVRAMRGFRLGHAAWANENHTTHGVIVNTAFNREEPLPFIHIRAYAAQVAFEIMRVQMIAKQSQ